MKVELSNEEIKALRIAIAKSTLMDDFREYYTLDNAMLQKRV